MSNVNELYQELLQKLATSDGDDRRKWAMQIVDSEIDLMELTPLLFADKKTAYRFSWLLSDVGEAKPEILFNVLSYTFEHRGKTDIPNFKQQFVKYWRLSGLPEDDKGTAIDLMFSLLTDPTVGVHIKSVASEVLYNLTGEYPELKNELNKSE